MKDFKRVVMVAVLSLHSFVDCSTQDGLYLNIISNLSLSKELSEYDYQAIKNKLQDAYSYSQNTQLGESLESAYVMKVEQKNRLVEAIRFANEERGLGSLVKVGYAKYYNSPINRSGDARSKSCWCCYSAVDAVVGKSELIEAINQQDLYLLELRIGVEQILQSLPKSR